jgi:hypothetical protein
MALVTASHRAATVLPATAAVILPMATTAMAKKISMKAKKYTLVRHQRVENLARSWCSARSC